MPTTLGVRDGRIKRWAAAGVVGSGGLVGAGSAAGAVGVVVVGLLAAFAVGGAILVLMVASTTGRRLVRAVRGDLDGPRHRPGDLLEMALAAAAAVTFVALPLAAGRVQRVVVGLAAVGAALLGTAVVVLARAALGGPG